METTPVVEPSHLTDALPEDGLFRILSLDGGGAKGFYTLGVLKEIEAMMNCPLHKRFDLVYGTSTGAIIAALIALGFEVDEIHSLYKEHVPSIMRVCGKKGKSKALEALSTVVFKGATFDSVKTGLGIVATNWVLEKPMIFKSSVQQAHGRKGTFVPGFGCSIGDAVQASCSAYPFFNRKVLVTEKSGDQIELIDGGYCANNPTLYAITDAVNAMERTRDVLRVISLGVGVYPEPPLPLFRRFTKRLLSVRLLQKNA